MTSRRIALDGQSELSVELIVQATRRWCGARRRSLPGAPPLHRLFAPLGLWMMAASFDSLLVLIEHAAGRPLVAGLAGDPSHDQRAICALIVTGRLAAGDGWLALVASRCSLAPAILCATMSVRIAAAFPDHGRSDTGTNRPSSRGD